MNSTVFLAGLGGAFAFGAGDFSGGFAARRDPVVRVVALSHLMAFVLYVAIALLLGNALPGLHDLLWASLAGVTGMVGILALYQGLATGSAGVVAATSAVLSTILPVSAGLILGERLHLIQGGGMVLALLGVVLLCSVPGGRGGIGLALLAGVGFGFFFICLSQTGPEATYWSLATARGISSTAMLLLAGFRSGLRPAAPLPIAFTALFDAAGNALFLLAAHTGHLALAGILVNLYPVCTVALSLLILHERLRAVQWLGFALTLLAVPLIVQH